MSGVGDKQKLTLPDTQFSQFSKERANDVLNGNNEIATLQKQLESRAVTTLQMQGNVDSSIRHTADKVLQLGQMLACIENLLERFETNARHVKRKKETKKAKVEASTAGE